MASSLKYLKSLTTMPTTIPLVKFRGSGAIRIKYLNQRVGFFSMVLDADKEYLLVNGVEECIFHCLLELNKSRPTVELTLRDNSIFIKCKQYA